MPLNTQQILATTSSISRFAQAYNGISLRRYQLQVAEAVVDSVKNRRGLTFVVIFPRQSGKNELQAQIESYIMFCLCQRPAEIVKVSPTWKPQSLNAMRRLERVLEHNYLIQHKIGFSKEAGYIFRVGKARIYFLSGSPTANIVGATASTLLEVDEAQDVAQAKYDKEINPMAASTNATRVFWGTAWTSQTLLAREMRAAQEAEQRDGQTRVFRLTAEEVGGEVPAYRQFVQNEIARLGRNHPFVRTQFYSEEIDAQGGMFTPERIALMRGAHAQEVSPPAGLTRQLAFLIDVGGEERDATPDATALFSSRHDASVLTCVWVDLSSVTDPVLSGPTYRVIWRRTWTGSSQTVLYSQMRSLVETWQPRRIVIDATGIGAGLAANLERLAGSTSVVPFTFTSKSKSDLAWNFISQIETGRYKEYSPFDEQLHTQLVNCQLEIIPGPARLCRWGVPDGRREAVSGTLIHDDLVLSAALCAELDRHAWGSAHSEVIRPADPLASLSFS